MSLFKVRDFWSFDLHQLHEHYGGGASGGEGSGEDIAPDEASFIASWGRFHSVGDQDVFVCAHLDGFICLLQLPESRKLKNLADEEAGEKPREHGDRQLLLSSKLDFPIVDVKCGYFASTLKQSIAVLSFDWLIVYQVKRRQVDLISASIDGQTSPELDASLLSHQLEERHRLNLTLPSTSGFPIGLVLMRNHLNVSEPKQETKSSHHNRHLATLQLPQRDSLVVQYTNQLVFTIVDHKKIVGHYNLTNVTQQQEQNNNMGHLVQNMGSMPICYLPNSLVVSTSDHRLHCLPLAKLLAQSKQSVMKRVAQNLLFEKLAHENKHGEVVKIQVEVNQVADWQLELATAPLEMHSIGNQLMVMSRHNLDLFSSSGQHLWSHRNETPLICVHTYLHKDKIMSLICSSSLSQDRCNLEVMEGDQIVWSAMLNTRPIQLWCANFGKMLGVLATISSNDACLNLSYLGTNSLGMEQELQAANELGCDDLLQLDDEFAFKERPLFESGNNLSKDDSVVLEEPQLVVEAKLEARGQWPSVQVEVNINVRVRSSASGVLQNIAAILEFDNLLHFELTDSGQLAASHLAEGVIQIQLGNCWPDRREPIVFTGCFSCHANHKPMLLPRSLKVKLYFKFSQLRRGVCFQEENFMLPLSMVTKLSHIDYSSGQNGQSLTDVQANLRPEYKRSVEGVEEEVEADELNALPYYLCDLFIKTHGDIVDLVDEIIESDLICRHGWLKESRTKEDHLRTMENITLLAQSLDCRLRYKPRLTRQSSEEYSPLVMVSIAMKIPNLKSIINGLVNSNDAYTTVWLHLCDLAAENTSIPEELIKQHAREWKTYEELDLAPPQDLLHKNRPILVSIESDHPVPVLFIQSHLVERLGERASILSHSTPFALSPMTETTCDQIEINQTEAFAHMSNTIVISTNLYDCLMKASEDHEMQVRGQMRQLKLELEREYYKFHTASLASISLAKRLFNLPNEMAQQFGYLTTLTKNYYMNLNRLLCELERLEKVEQQFRKLPEVLFESSRFIQ